MIHIEESDPIGENTSSFKPRDVQIIYGKDPKQQFELLTEIGRGKFGTVYRCKEKESDLIVAAKFIPIPKREDRRNVEREVEIMNSLQHHLIIQLYAAFEYKKIMCVVQELVEGGELFDRVIDDDFVLTEKACSVFVRQICQAMEFIHRNKIIHLDLKPENILCLTREGNRIKIIDFGLARKFDPDKKLQVLFGTPEFVAPEVVNFDQITFGTDMWSIGVICYVLISGLSPFMGETDIATMANVTIAKYDFDDEAFANVSEDALDFINKLLIKDSKSRMTASKCLEHRWLKQKPSVPPKPKVVIPPKIITEPPAQIVNGLDKTKENLKNFIERWEEHPNSPYVFDTGNHLISPIIDDVKNSNSVLSSRGCSPSPCGSISSTPERELPQPVEYERPLPLSPPIVMSPTTTRNGRKPRPRSELFSFKSEEYDDSRSAPFKEYLQSFERRNSDSNFLTNKSNSTEKLNLAEEIKKLSERLLMLSSINTQPERKSDEIITKPTTNGTAKPDGVVSVKPSIREKTDEVKSIAIARRNEFMNGQSSDMKQESRFYFMNGGSSTASMRSSFTRSSSVGSSVFKSSTSSVQSQQVFSSSRNGHVRTLNEHLKSIEETPTISSGMTSRKSVIREESQSIEDSATAFGGGGVPWPITNRRTKFRISQLSRDVPVGLPDTHQNLEVTASTTKDCLLHLLEKYNETTSKEKHRHSGIGGRHQSISVEWGLSDNLEYQSINSLNAFFQRNSKNMGNQVRQIQSKIESKNNAI